MKKILLIINLLFYQHFYIVAQQPTIVEIDKIINERMNQTVPIIGSVESKKEAQLMASVAGKIDQILVDEGTIVQKGQVLAKVDYKNYKYLYNISEANVNKAKALYESSKLETEKNYLDLKIMEALKNSSAFNNAKLNKLIKMDLILKENEKVALAELEVSNSLKNIAKLNMRKSNVKAAFDGVIEELYVEEGEVANIGTPLFKLIDRNKLEILAEVPTSRALNLSKNNNIDLYTTDNVKLIGKIKSVGSTENKKTRTTKVYLDFQIANESGIRELLPGESINLMVPISFGKNKLTIHKDAILKRQGMSLAYLVEQNKVEIRPLKLGDAVGNRFILLEGLKENDVVVIKGNERLRPGQEITIINK